MSRVSTRLKKTPSKKRIHPKELPQVLFIVGPTSSGKTKLSLALAKKFQGEIINADARQVYRGFSKGTGKPNGIWQTVNGQRAFWVDGIAHYLMDYLSPEKTSTVVEWREQALRLIRKIISRGHLPMVVGGTGLYVQSLLDHFMIPPVAPDPGFREAIASKTLPELVALLESMDPQGAQTVDLKNPRRVVRALEIVTFTGKSLCDMRGRKPAILDSLLLARAHAREELNQRISESVDQMLANGWVDEVRGFLEKGIPPNAPAMSSIGYRELSASIEGRYPIKEAAEKIKKATRQYAKRQMTWFKRDKRIHWIQNESEAEALIKAWKKETKKSEKKSQTIH